MLDNIGVVKQSDYKFTSPVQYTCSFQSGAGGQAQLVLARLVYRKARRAAAVNGAKRSS